MVGVGLLGSLGVAGFLASSTAHNQPVAAGAGTSQVSGWGSGEDDGSVREQGQGVVLQPGGASGAHATTGGSVHVSSGGPGQSGPATTSSAVGLSPGSGSVHASTAGS